MRHAGQPRVGSRGAKVAADYGSITPDADHIWAPSVTLAQLQPGDVIQFRDYTFDDVPDTIADFF
jgi:hypothetical protein